MKSIRVVDALVILIISSFCKVIRILIADMYNFIDRAMGFIGFIVQHHVSFMKIHLVWKIAGSKYDFSLRLWAHQSNCVTVDAKKYKYSK
jgi:hypothetical protein